MRAKAGAAAVEKDNNGFVNILKAHVFALRLISLVREMPQI